MNGLDVMLRQPESLVNENRRAGSAHGRCHEEKPAPVCAGKLQNVPGVQDVVPDNIQYFNEKAKKITEAIQKSMDDVREHGDAEQVRMFKEHPFYDPPGFDQWITNLFENGRFVNL